LRKEGTNMPDNTPTDDAGLPRRNSGTADIIAVTKEVKRDPVKLVVPDVDGDVFYDPNADTPDERFKVFPDLRSDAITRPIQNGAIDGNLTMAGIVDFVKDHPGGICHLNTSVSYVMITYDYGAKGNHPGWREIATVPIANQMSIIKVLDPKERVSQDDLLETLVYGLHGVVDPDGELVEAVRRIEWGKNDEARERQELDKTVSSLSLESTQKFTASGDFPRFFALDVPLFARDPDSPEDYYCEPVVPVGCCVTVDAKAKAFRFFMQPNEDQMIVALLRKAVNDAIVQHCGENVANVYA